MVQLKTNFTFTNFNFTSYISFIKHFHIFFQNKIFNLYAVINHNGGYSGGHYNALIKSDPNQKWYSFDDRTVTEVGYMLIMNKNLNS